MREYNNSGFGFLLDAIEEGVLIIDLDFKVRHFNANLREVFNLTSDDIGRSFFNISDIPDYDHALNDIKKVKTSHIKIDREISTTDNRRFNLQLIPYKSSEDEVTGIAFLFSEITTVNIVKNKLSKRRDQQKILRNLGLYALSRDNPKEVIHRSLQIICKAMRLDYGIVLEYDRKKRILKLVDSAALYDKPLQNLEVNMDPKWDAVAVFDKKKEFLGISDFDQKAESTPVLLAKDKNISSSINMRIEGCTETYGILGGYAKESRTFNEFNKYFLQAVANIISETIERAQREKELEEEIEQSKEYQEAIVQSSVDERWNIGGYLHDTLGQDLTSIKIMISSIKNQVEKANLDLMADFDTVLERIDKTISGIRDLTHEVIPVDIEEEGGTEHAFRVLIRDLQKRHNINCSLDRGRIIDKIKDKEVATNLYHIIQEAIKNAAVHGEADNVTVRLAEEDGYLKLEIIDDGKGLPGVKQEEETGSGTNIMKHRIEVLGGSFKREEITKEGEIGTCVTLMLPLSRLSE